MPYGLGENGGCWPERDVAKLFSVVLMSLLDVLLVDRAVLLY